MLKERLKELREKKGLSQKALGELIGAGQQTIAGWETGVRKPNSDCISALADALECTADELLGR